MYLGCGHLHRIPVLGTSLQGSTEETVADISDVLHYLPSKFKRNFESLKSTFLQFLQIPSENSFELAFVVATGIFLETLLSTTDKCCIICMICRGLCMKLILIGPLTRRN